MNKDLINRSSIVFRWDFSCLPNFLSDYINQKGEIGPSYIDKKFFSADQCIELDIDDVANRFNDDNIEHFINIPYYEFSKVKVGGVYGQVVVSPKFIFFKVPVPFDQDAFYEELTNLFLDNYLIDKTDTKGLACIYECITKVLKWDQLEEELNINYFTKMRGSMVINGRYSDEFRIGKYENCLIRTIRNKHHMNNNEIENSDLYEISIKNYLYKSFDDDLAKAAIGVFQDMVEKSKEQVDNCFKK